MDGSCSLTPILCFHVRLRVLVLAQAPLLKWRDAALAYLALKAGRILESSCRESRSDGERSSSGRASRVARRCQREGEGGREEGEKGCASSSEVRNNIPRNTDLTSPPPSSESAMALPGLSLPGLGQAQPPGSSALSSGADSLPQQSRTEDLPPRTEWRFEVAFNQSYSIKLLSGHAEIFGVELAPKQFYVLSGVKGSVFTWQGCRLEVTGDAESEYAGQETEHAVEWLNVHGMLETARDDAPQDGPRVLVVGPDFVGKSSLVRSLAGWAVKVGRTPTIVNTDPREGLLAPPGSITAATVGSQLDVENGYGIAPISGATMTPVKIPLVYHCPYASPAEKPNVYKAVLTRTALSVTNRLEEDPAAKQSGLVIDTPGSLNDPKSGYDMISHLVSEFSITLILTIGSERLYNDLNRKYGTPKPNGDPAIPVLRITKPGGAVERDSAFMDQLRHQQIHQYFFGTPKERLNPHSHTVPFSDLTVYRANSPSLSAALQSDSFANSGGAEDLDDIPYASKPGASGLDFEKVTLTNDMLGRLCAVKFADTKADEVAIRDSAVMGFAYVAEVDEMKKRVRFLTPHPQRWGDRVLVFGGYPGVVVDLVA